MKLGLINSAWAQAGRDTAYGIRRRWIRRKPVERIGGERHDTAAPDHCHRPGELWLERLNRPHDETPHRLMMSDRGYSCSL